MIKKDEYLDNDNSIKIKSYNYEKSNGFSQETAVDSVYSTRIEHKFIIEINNTNYEVIFQDSEVTDKYAAMEDEWVEMENKTNSNTLNIAIFENNESCKYPNNILELKNFNSDIKNFKELLIKSATEKGIGCHHSDHFNREDDYGLTTPNREDQKPRNISNEALFINDNEKEFFEEFLKLETHEDEQAFLYDVEKRIADIEKAEKNKQELLEQKQKKEAKEKISKIVNPLFEELKKLDDEKRDYISFINFEPKGEQYTIEEIKTEINNLDKKDEIYYEEEKNALESLIEYIPKAEEIKKKILEHILEVEYFDVLENYEYGNSDKYIYPAPEMQAPWEYPDYEKDYPEEPEFISDELQIQSQDEWLDYQYTKPRTLPERFEAIKVYFKNQLSLDVVPNELQKTFDLKNEVAEFLGNKINETNPVKRKSTIKRQNK
tara:strand:+ start:34337 stop:35638 length:1302 start_codon:yes stop_codon:yes gene_type:complete